MADTTTGSHVPNRIPFWRTVCRSYQSVLDNFDTLLRMSWPWLLVVLVPEVLLAWLNYPLLTSPDPVPDPDQAAAAADFYWRASSIWTLIGLVPASAIAVKWHKFILNGVETPATSPLLPPEFAPYFAIAAFLALVTYAPAWAMAAVPQLVTEDSFETGALIIAFLIVLLAVIVVTSRLSVALPGIAVKGPGQTLVEAWRATRGNTRRLFFGPLLTLVPVLALYSLVNALAAVAPSRLVFAVVGGGLATVSLVLLTISVSFLSFAWRHLFAARDPE